MTETLERLRLALADRYRLERELGQGSIATVYLAEDLKDRRRVALKVLRPEWRGRSGRSVSSGKSAMRALAVHCWTRFA
jgi:predicted unusual protein kinase regulating ubiquinone biosynthesis (AarF/ABC1/UbiB family)